jgi:hypothetical protein
MTKAFTVKEDALQTLNYIKTNMPQWYAKALKNIGSKIQQDLKKDLPKGKIYEFPLVQRDSLTTSLRKRKFAGKLKDLIRYKVENDKVYIGWLDKSTKKMRSYVGGDAENEWYSENNKYIAARLQNKGRRILEKYHLHDKKSLPIPQRPIFDLAVKSDQFYKIVNDRAVSKIKQLIEAKKRNWQEKQ